MTREEYLKDRDVKEFVGWLGERLDNETEDFARKTGYKSLFDAFSKYEYKNKDFAADLDELQGYSKRLREAVLVNSCLRETKEVCRDIFKWGGITHGEIRDKLFSDGKCPDLVSYLDTVSRKLDPNSSTCDTDNLFWDIRINSGLVKIYSLLIDDFVMYDSRIGSGLCDLVLLFCKDTLKKKGIPSSLRFSWGDKRDDNTHSRDPSEPPDYVFPKFDDADNNRDRVRHTIQASWILKAVLEKKPESKFWTDKDASKDPVRALADALFMIGQ